MNRVLSHVLLPLLVVGGAAGGTASMMRTATTTEAEPVEKVAPLVEVAKVKPYSQGALITASGVIEAEREATISPEVTGKILDLSPSLVEGGRLQEGEMIARLDGRTYEATLAQQKALVEQAKLNLEIERSAADAARREWEVSGTEPPPEARRIALREPQVDVAKANIEAARSAMESAKLSLSRTTLRAPFNATVIAETVEVGEVVGPGNVIATLVGTDRFLARVSLPVEQLAFVELPDAEGEGGSKATVRQRLAAGNTVVREGKVLRVVMQLDGQSRMAQVLVAVDDPIDTEPGELPLFVGAFVAVEIQGRPIPDALAVPRTALFGGNEVWVVDAAGKLQRRELGIAFDGRNEVIVTSGVEAGDDVVTTKLGVATEGMPVRRKQPGAAEQADA